MGRVLEPREAKEPHPFEPLWMAGLGPIVEEGRGLLTPLLHKNKELIDFFDVHVGPFKISVRPKDGKIFLDGSIAIQMSANSTLLWFRRMEQQIASYDPNGAAARCLWYWIGLADKESSIGFCLYEDGRLTQMIP